MYADIYIFLISRSDLRFYMFTLIKVLNFCSGFEHDLTDLFHSLGCQDCVSFSGWYAPLHHFQSCDNSKKILFLDRTWLQIVTGIRQEYLNFSPRTSEKDPQISSQETVGESDFTFHLAVLYETFLNHLFTVTSIMKAHCCAQPDGQ